MIGIQLFIGFNGEPTPIDDIEDLRSLYHLLGLYFKSEENAVPQRPVPKTLAENARNGADISDKPVDDNVPSNTVNSDLLLELSRSPNRQPAGQTSREYARRAGLSFNSPVTVRDVAAKMLELGWPTKAKDTRTVLSTVRTAMHEAGFRSVEDGLWELDVSENEDTEVSPSYSSLNALKPPLDVPNMLRRTQSSEENDNHEE